MAGGSQLSLLKNTLRDSGLSRTSSPKDPRKRNKQRKQLSSTSQSHRAASLAAIGTDFNKFDSREENKKFQVVTRQGKLEEGKKGAPGKSRQAGLEQRKKILLPQLEARNHTSTFLDRRFGENSTTLTPEEKALERFTAERTSRLGGSKKARFNLEDGDDDADVGGDLTHGGRKLGFGDEDELEAGGWGGLGDAIENGATDSNRTPLLRRRMEAQAEEDEQPARKRTKAEIMEEVVAKSKAYKYERQKTKSADDEARIALDSGLKDLRLMLGGGATVPRPAVASSSKIEEEDAESEDEDEEEGSDDGEEDGEDSDGSEGFNDEELEAALAGKSGVDRDLLRKLIGGGGSDSGSEEEFEVEPTPSSTATPNFENNSTDRPAPADVEKDADPYDSYVRLLALEPRAHASDRLKTPLELAKDAAKELEDREEKRLRRQRGEADEEEDEANGVTKKRKRAAQGDDLEDDFLDEGEGSEVDFDEGLGKGLDGGFGHQVIEDKSEEEESEGDEDEEEDDDNEEEGSDFDAAEDFDEPEEELDTSAPEALVTALAPEATKSRTWGGKDVKPELPFTFPCPSTHAEFATLLSSSGVAEADTATVVKRIRVLYHPGLGEANKGKLQVFTNVLLDHVLHLSVTSATPYATINSLLPHLLTLSYAFPLTTAPYYVDKLALMQKNFVRGVARGPLEPSSKTWPAAPELTLLRLVGIVWSTSDLSHPVAAGAMLLIGQYLSQARIRTLSDISSGLFLCTLAAQYETLSKRLVPESLNFLLNSLLVLLPTSITSKTAPGSFPSPDLGQEHTKSLKLRSSDEFVPRKLNFSSSMKGKASDSQLKVDLIASILALLKDAAEKYVSMEAFVELFRPTEAILEKVSKSIPSAIKIQIVDLQAAIQRMIKFSTSSRKPLILQHHKPIPIATFIPKFDEGYNPNRRFDPDTERAEASKLKSLYKKEKKGAIRELRKDNKFLSGEEQKRKNAESIEYNKKMAKIMGSLQDERAEEKLFDRTKAKGKRQDKARKGK